MGTNSVKAMKLLVSTGGLSHFSSFRIKQLQQYMTLLKCTHNLSLKCDLQFKSECLDSQLPVIAKWEHIEKLYKRDKPFMIRSLYKLTDTHLAPVTLCVMKVSLAAQVMSHTVAAGIYSLVSSRKEQCLHSFCFHKR